MINKQIEKEIDCCLDAMENANTMMEKALVSNDDELFKSATELYKVAKRELEELRKMKNESQNTIGRPSLGVTKKVSVTMPEEYWVLLDQIKKDTGMSYSSIFAAAVQVYVNQFESN